jgi:hypothetical protein
MTAVRHFKRKVDVKSAGFIDFSDFLQFSAVKTSVCGRENGAGR